MISFSPIDSFNWYRWHLHHYLFLDFRRESMRLDFRRESMGRRRRRRRLRLGFWGKRGRSCLVDKERRKEEEVREGRRKKISGERTCSSLERVPQSVFFLCYANCDMLQQEKHRRKDLFLSGTSRTCIEAFFLLRRLQTFFSPRSPLLPFIFLSARQLLFFSFFFFFLNPNSNPFFLLVLHMDFFLKPKKR